MTYPATAPRRHHLTVSQFQQMIAHGILTKDDRVELLNGEILAMSPINPSHAGTVNRLTRLLVRLVDDQAVVTIQNPIQLDEQSQPQPDICLLKPRADDYTQSHALPDEVLLVIEVAETSARLDRSVKRPAYARAGIPELWIIDLKKKVVEVYRDPLGGEYQNTLLVRGGQTLAPQALPEVELNAAMLLS
jgi:Uma2 family endonuclease